jgi:hypothetical protein
MEIRTPNGTSLRPAESFSLGTAAIFVPHLHPGVHKLTLRPLSIFAPFKLRFELFSVGRAVSRESVQVVLLPWITF